MVPALESSAAAKPMAAPLKAVEEPSLSEQMNDELPSKGGEGVSDRKVSSPPDLLAEILN